MPAESIRDPGHVRRPDPVGGVARPEALGLESMVRAAGLAYRDHGARRLRIEGAPALAAAAAPDLGQVGSNRALHASYHNRLMISGKPAPGNEPVFDPGTGPGPQELGSCGTVRLERTQDAGAAPSTA